MTLRAPDSGNPTRALQAGAAISVAGVLWMLGSLMSFIGMAVASRNLSAGMPIIQILVLRSLVGLVVVMALLPRLWPELRQRRDMPLHLARNTVHFGAQYAWTLGVALLPLAQVFALEFTMPIWVALFAWAALGERISRTRIIGIGVSFLGVLIVLRPGAGMVDPAALIVLLAAAGYGASAVFVKRLTRHSSAAVIVLWMVVLQLPMGAAALALSGGWVTPQAGDLPWIIILGLTALSAHYTMARALRVMDASIAVPIDFLRVPLIALIGWLLYAEPVSASVFVGAAIIVSANFAAMRAEARARRTVAAGVGSAAGDGLAGAVAAPNASARRGRD